MSNKTLVCKQCGKKLYTIKDLTDYDLRDGIRNALYCDACHTVWSSHAYGLGKVASLASVSRIAELEAERDRLKELAYPDGPEKDAAVPMSQYEPVYNEVHRLRDERDRLVEEVRSVADSLFPGPAYGKLKAALDAAKE